MNRAIANNWPKVPILVAARNGKNEAAAKKLTALGGEVHFRADEIDYIRGVMPTARVNELFRSEEVLDVLVGNFALGESDWDKAEPKRLPAPNPAARAPAPEPSKLPVLPASEMTAENPYLPTRDIGAPQFVKAHPTFDGRGVTIGIVEFWSDLDHPTLRTAKTLDGKEVPKIVGILDVADLDHEDLSTGSPVYGKPSPVYMRTQVEVTGPTFEQDGHKYIAPAPGAYRFGKYSFASRKDVPVLWAPERNLVWVDTNGNSSFADEKPIHDFNETHDLAYFPAAQGLDARRVMSFAVTIDASRNVIRLHESLDKHATAVASVAAGKGFLGGEANGVGPEAQLLFSVVWNNRVDRFAEAVLAVAKDPRVDVISSSTGTNTLPDDGESFLSIVLERIAAHFDKPIVRSAGNSNWTETERVGDEANAPGVIAVGGYNRGATRRVMAANSVDAEDGDFINRFSSHGPSSVGALKPDVVAPNWGVTAIPCGVENSRTILAAFRLPDCYFVGNGTSEAAPITAGALALLVSAAKQLQLEYNHETLCRALIMSARHFSGSGVHEEGSGLIQVEDAWKLLTSYVKQPEATVEFLAPITHQLGRYMRTPREGVGLYERTGWSPSQEGTRIVKLFRRGGPPGRLRCRIALLGSDGTFSAPQSVDLPKASPVEISIQIKTSTAGIHDAILRLLDADSDTPLGQTALTVIASTKLDNEHKYRAEVRPSLGEERQRSLYVDVSPGTPCLRVRLTATGEVGLLVENPSLLRNGFRGAAPRGSGSHLEWNPEPGLWVFRVTAAKNASEFSLQVEAVGAKVTMQESISKFAPVANLTRLEKSGAKRTISVPASTSEAKIMDLSVPPGTDLLLLKLKGASRDVPVDLYLYKCEAEKCKFWEMRSAAYGPAQMLVHWPEPGQWKVIIDPLRSLASDLTLSEVITGSVPAGSEWTSIKLIEAIDSVTEREEDIHPLLDLSRWPGSSLRPVPLGLAILPETPFGGPVGRAGNFKIQQERPMYHD